MRLLMPASKRARRLPWLASCSSRVGRSFTMANSAATKKPLARTITTVTMIAIVGLIGAPSTTISQVVESVPGNRAGGGAGDCVGAGRGLGRRGGGQNLGRDPQRERGSRPALLLAKTDGGLVVGRDRQLAGQARGRIQDR